MTVRKAATKKKAHGNKGKPKSAAHRAAISKALKKFHRSKKRGGTTKRKSPIKRRTSVTRRKSTGKTDGRGHAIIRGVPISKNSMRGHWTARQWKSMERSAAKAAKVPRRKYY